ncbi:pre-rRNA-processing protein ESF1 [Babesia caballi]|uniref:Pre-rRNA-processing protein ESF1 n=1 Tax=Babesia caballi TaxID=5871 RepID=A0AAV4LPG9_BABCB|nr:pre-rRNA-processing protein ESF1 [Babesia caballi]
MEQDDRFVPTVRFKRPRKEVKPRSDPRFSRLFESEAAPRKGAPKIDPFGRPLGGASDGEESSSDEESEDSLESSPGGSATVAEDEQEQLEYGDVSNRLAVVGCDWDNISASDLFVLFETMYRSLTSNSTRCVRRAAVYLSDFGQQRVEHENLHGPTLPPSEDVREEELDDTARQEALRKYQKDRSRYYYGIVEFESTDQAKLLYDEMDGVEAYFAFAGLDLRFVPSEVTFEREPTSECCELPDNYEPPLASTSAFRHSKVECKWDMPTMKRFKTLTKRFKEQDVESLELKEYLASDDDDEVNVDEFKSLLGTKPENTEPVKLNDGKVRAKVGKYTISFGAPQDIPDIAEPELVTAKGASDRRKPKAKKCKAKRITEEDDAEPDDARDFDARISREQQPGFEGDLEDARFKRVLREPDFAIDTRHPKYRGAGADAADELLRSVSVEDIVLNLSQLGDECFPSHSDEEGPQASAGDEQYVGLLLVRVLDALLDRTRLTALFQNPEVMKLLSQRVMTSSAPVRLLFAKKCKLFFADEGASSEVLGDVLWRLLFDQEYYVFESCSHAISAVGAFLRQNHIGLQIVARDPTFLKPSYLEQLASTLKGPDSDGILHIRIIEFCVMLGDSSPSAFKALLDAGLCSAIFSYYITADYLLKLNCLEILERSPAFVSRLQKEAQIPRDFIEHALRVTSEEAGSEDELLVPFLFRMLVSLLRLEGTLTHDDCAAFGGVVSRTILQSRPQKATPRLLSALECFGTLYLLGHLSAAVCGHVVAIVSETTQDSVLAAVLVSLTFMCNAALATDKLVDFCALTRCVIKALARFPLSDTRELAYHCLSKALRYDEVLACVTEAESAAHLLSAEESLYANAVAKKQLVRTLLRRMDELYVGTANPLGADRVNALRDYARR